MEGWAVHPCPAASCSGELRQACFGLIERALIKHHANVRAAARELNVPSGDLRKLTWSHPRLIELAWRRLSCLIDRAEENDSAGGS